MRQVDSKSNNGLKWKTLCRQCNGDIVGCWDPALGEFTKRAEVLLSRSVMLPKCVALKIRGGAVLRSILGHVVAAKTQGDAVPMDAKIRDYLLGRTTLHPAVQVFCWLYPFPPIIVARDFSWVEVVGEGGGSPGLATVVKFFPLAILVLDANEKGTLETKYMTPIHPFASMGDVDEAEIEMWRDPIFHPGWPERAMGNHVVIGGRSYRDSVTTVAEGGAFVTPGKQIEEVSWAQGDAANLPDGLHAFAEVPGERRTRT